MISIIIPVRNQPSTLRTLLSALVAQKRPAGWGVEVICVDNASTDNTADVIREFDVRYLLEETLGPSVARNRGAAEARGELLWFIDADAVPLGDNFLVRLVDVAKDLGEFGGIGGPILLPAEQRKNPVAFADHMACWSAWSNRRATAPSDFQPTSLVVPRAVFERVGGYDTKIRVLEDWDLQLRIRNLAVDAADKRFLIWFVREMAVAHSARSSILRTLHHSWYWGLPSRAGWLEKQDYPGVFLNTPVLRWLELPRIFLMRIRLPLRVGWQTSRSRALVSFPFLCVTILVWAVAVIVGKGQPEAGRKAPI